MPTFTKQVENNRVLIQVAAGVSDSDMVHRFMALVDTGAQEVSRDEQGRCKDRSRIHRPRLDSSRQRHPGGNQPIRTSSCDPCQCTPRTTDAHTLYVAGRPLVVFELPYQPPDYDVLLGMDVLSLFHITMYSGMFVMSN